MNLTVRAEIKQGDESEGTAIALINALHLVAAVHPDFKGKVSVSAENLDGQTLVSFDIDSLQVNWGLGLSNVYGNEELLKPIPMEEAKTRIRELTSPKVDQPAPDEPKAAEIQWRDWLVIGANSLCYSTCESYMLQRHVDGSTSAYYLGGDRRELLEDVATGIREERLYTACQAHKQRRLNELL